MSTGLALGGFIAGLAVNRIGRRLCILAGFVSTIAGVFGEFFATTPPVFFVAKLLTSIPLGIFTTAAPTYAAEIAPMAVRGATTAAVNFAIVFGQFLGFAAMRQVQISFTGKATYQTLFAVQWGFAAVGLAVLPFFPE